MSSPPPSSKSIPKNNPPLNSINHLFSTTFFADSNRLLAANNAHFLCLLLPLSISLTSLLSFLHFTTSISLTSTSIPLSFLYALFVLSLYIFGIATITYSTKQGLYGKPPNLSSAIGSISNSLFPLASTTLASFACLLISSSAFLLLFVSFLSSLRILGLKTNYYENNSTFSVQFHFISFAVIFLLFLILFHVIFTLAAIISVVESKWWFEPLRRSFFLVKGMARASFLILLLRGISIWVFVLGISMLIFITDSPWSYVDVLQILNVSFFWTILLAPLVIQYTVLYLKCKDLHEDSGFDMAVEVSKECVGLAIDDKKLVRESNVKRLVFLAVFMVLLITLIVAVKLEIL